MDYRKEIDGLRALAVLPVILFHAGFETFSGGFVGVDIFFVISGYLITMIILAELERGKFSLVNFYERRARRILPALFLVMLFCIPIAWLMLLTRDITEFFHSLVAVPVFASNILFWNESGYFEVTAELKPLLHTWSLAVEEQYYVLFPLFLMLFWRFGKRRIIIALAIVFVASLVLAQWAAYAIPGAAFYLLPTRGWELLVGAFAAFYFSRTHRKDLNKKISELGGWLGVVLILYSVFMYSKETPFPSLYALVPVVGALLIILFATQETTVGRFVGNKFFVDIGLISYSAYLWHQPLFAFARRGGVSGDILFVLLSLLTLVLAYLSWRYVEGYFRDRALVGRKEIFIYSLCGSIFFVFIGLVGHFGQETISKLRFSDSQLLAINSASPSPKRSMCHFPQNEDSLLREPCRYFSENARLAVFGNSHATELAYALGESLMKRGVGVIQNTISGCNHNYNIASELDTICGGWHKKVVADLVADTAIKVVVLSYRNEGYLGKAVYREALASMANDLVSSGKSVFLVLQAPLPVLHIYEHLSRNMPDLSGSIPSRKREDWDLLYSSSKELLTLLNERVKVVDPADLFCDSDYCYATRDGISLYFDGDHISVEGGRIIAKHLLKDLFVD
jgi:peptidoglycan/LPS O-acetylase OafA/YrhL